MADPAMIDKHAISITYLIIYHGPAFIAGTVVIVGGTMLILKRLGFLVFSRNKLKPCADMPFTGLDRRNRCEGHEVLQGTVDSIQVEQGKMVEQHRINTVALRDGKKEFKKIQDHISNLRVGVAVLLERSGGKPVDWHQP